MLSAWKSFTTHRRPAAHVLQDVSVWLVLIATGVAARLIWAELPNFKPLAGMALFAGFYFTRTRVAMTVPLTILLVSDYWLGGYQPLLRLAVYGTLLLPVLLSPFVRRAWHSRHGSSWTRGVTACATLVGCSLGASLCFFLVTNLCTWLVTPWYPRTALGLWECYVAALPFFRYTVAGDLLFTLGLFASWQLAGFAMRRPMGQRSWQAPAEIAA